MALFIGDCEVAPNYLLALFKHLKTGQAFRWERWNDREYGMTRAQLSEFLRDHTVIGFNWNHYDFAIAQAYCNGYHNEQIKAIGDWIIGSDDPLASYRVLEHHGLPDYPGRVIDLMPVAPLMASLKVYAARARSLYIKDLPYHHMDELDADMRQETLDYCEQDLDNTRLLFDTLRPELKLRNHLSGQYGTYFMSSSDAQIAEKAMKILVGKAGGRARKLKPHERPKPPFKYKPPEYLKFETAVLNNALANVQAIEFGLDKKGDLAMPDELKEITVDDEGNYIRLRKDRTDPSIINFEGAKYKLGIGGLHSQESKQYVVPEGGSILFFADVASYYPSLVLTNNWYPRGVGEVFVEQYRSIVETRLKAKADGDKVTADSLKIVINSIFGKTGNRHSAFYDPELLLHVTLTGQFALLLLIEMITGRSKCVVYSANTDGVLVWAPDRKEHDKGIAALRLWEERTGLVLEEEYQKAVASRDVNNYIAVGIDYMDDDCIMQPGKIKGKGVFAKPGLRKSPAYPIIPNAVKNYIDTGKPVADTVNECQDLFEFVNLRKSTGGATWRGKPAGVTCRWYHGKDGSPITTIKGNQVANSEKAVMVQTMPRTGVEMTAHLLNVDREFYIQKATELLRQCGIAVGPV